MDLRERWVLVPREPTEAMELAGWASLHDLQSPYGTPDGCYRAMIAAAPAPPSEPEGIALMARAERFEDCLRTVCHHLELPQSESGPCDDPSRYDRSLEGLIEALNIAEAEKMLASERRFRAEAALQPFADAVKGLSDFWSGERHAGSIGWDGLKVDHFRKAKQALAVNGPPLVVAAAPDAPEGMQEGGWRPIESAPRDGTRVRVLQANGDEDEVIWEEYRACMLGARAGCYGPGWQSTENNLPVCDDPGFEFTHWRPAPPPENPPIGVLGVSGAERESSGKSPAHPQGKHSDGGREP